MSCEVTLRERAISHQEGKFVDLKKFPERINDLHEAKVWPALGQFIQGINSLRDFRTCGSKAEGETPGGYPDAFVDITFTGSRSAEVLTVMRQQFETLNDVRIADDLEIEVCESCAFFPNGEEAHSTRIWFKGKRDQAEQAFPVVLGFLAAQAAFAPFFVALIPAKFN